MRQVDLTRSTQDWNLTPKASQELYVNPLSIAGKKFTNGLSYFNEGSLRFELNGNAQKFHTLFGIDDRSNKKFRAVFSIIVDNKEVFKSPILKKGSKPIEVHVDLTGVKRLLLVVDDKGTGLFADKADYANGYITYKKDIPIGFNFNYISKRHIITPLLSPNPKLNGARTFGVRPGNPFLFRVTATGKRPMTFAAENLPPGLSIDKNTGIITGVVREKGETVVKLSASNELGTTARNLKIVVGEKIALTPPMGWNGYNRYADSIDQAIVKSTVDAMISSGLVNHGWNYINIDDSWSIKPGTADSMRSGEARDADGMINANNKFPDIKELTDYIHSKGFKAGIYSSPNKLTCSGYTASYGFEEEDARRWAEWGFDYLKYDYCRYDDMFNKKTLEVMQKPYIRMRRALDKVDRDIVFSMSQYGMGDVWEWGEEIGGNTWRTTGDLIDTWESFTTIAFSQAGLEKYAGPGHWNDPDMLVVGYLGWGEIQYPSRLRADEQYTHMSLWAMLSSPLLIGCDIIDLDDFTKSLLTNDEVIDINQDPLGKQAARIFQKDGFEIWMKELEDGSKAVGLFNRNSSTETIKAEWNVLKIDGKHIVRDVWRQNDEGAFNKYFSARIPAHGVKLITLRKAK
jgi:alpha-galactosidase